MLVRRSRAELLAGSDFGILPAFAWTYLFGRLCPPLAKTGAFWLKPSRIDAISAIVTEAASTGLDCVVIVVQAQVTCLAT